LEAQKQRNKDEIEDKNRLKEHMKKLQNEIDMLKMELQSEKDSNSLLEIVKAQLNADIQALKESLREYEVFYFVRLNTHRKFHRELPKLNPLDT
jgi:chromosome segregation ATPase